MAEAVTEVETEEVDDLELALRENAKLKAENVRLKKGKKGEADTELKDAEKASKLSGHKLKAAENNKKLHELHPHKTDWSLRIILFFALIAGACFLVSGGVGNSQAFDSALYQAEAGLQNLATVAVTLAVCAAILYILFSTVRSPSKKSSGNKDSHH